MTLYEEDLVDDLEPDDEELPNSTNIIHLQQARGKNLCVWISFWWIL